MKWDKVHKLIETINNHRKTGSWPLPNTDSWVLLPGRSWVWLQVISEKTQPPAEPPAATAPSPSWWLFSICVVCGVGKALSERLGEGGAGMCEELVLCLAKARAVLCRRMWWGDTRWGSAGAAAGPRLGSSCAAGQGSCTGQLYSYKTPAWLSTAGTLPLTPCSSSLFEQHLPEPILASPVCCCTL